MAYKVHCISNTHQSELGLGTLYVLRTIRFVCLRADITGSNLCKAAIIRCLFILHPLDCKAPRIKPIPDWGAEVRICLTKLSKAASEISQKLLPRPTDKPNSCRRRDRVLVETPSILAISVHLKNTPSLND